MAGYSGKPLVAKLDIKSGYRVQLRGAPPGFAAELGALPDGAELAGPRARTADCILLFAASVKALKAGIGPAAAALPPAGLLWLAWPKRAAGVATDLGEREVRAIGLAAGLVDVKVCAVNEVWSGLKFVRRLRDRPAPR